MQKSTITIDADASPFLSALKSVSEFGNVSLEIVQPFIGLIESGTQPFRLELDGSTATGTGNLRVIFQPSHSLLEFVTALRASDINRSAAEKV